jgi:GT2 family glycosyltransferase
MAGQGQGYGARVTDDVTVVVASRNRREDLLATIVRHEAPVLYVDNASTDGSVKAVRSSLPAVRVAPLDRNRGAAARTLGARLARTPFVAFADDDSWWAPGALQAGADLLRRHPRTALINTRVVLEPSGLTDPICHEMANSPLDGAGDLPGPRLLGFVACAAMVRRDAFLEIGGFDDVVRFPGEEERVAIDLTATGWGIAYVDDVVVHHQPSPRRDDPQVRRAKVVRSSLLTAVMRRPRAVLAARTRAALRDGSTGRAGVRAALPDVPRAVAARRRIPDAVEADLQLLSNTIPAHAPRGPLS